MDHTVSRRSLIGAFGAGALLSQAAGASTRHRGPAIVGIEVALEFLQVVDRARISARIRVLAHVSQQTFDALRISVHPGNDAAQLDRCANALRRLP